MKIYAYLTVLLFTLSSGFAQGFLHVENRNIVDGAGNNVLLRGIGLGGWMLQEGYMMQTAAFANAQYQLKAKITELIGTEKTTDFYEAWRENYVQKADIDTLKSWGFNSIRLPMHYNLYTLPIEQEPVQGENTWLEAGFALTDRLLSWCTANEIYLILDLHAAPGGQGKDSGISDYDPTKPSLWESADNRSKTVALWRKLAERYADEPWIGGYDLINETNWSLTNNRPLKDLYVAITNAIREVDTHHILFIEGNWFANDFTGLTPPWDANMVYSFHKYWSYNTTASIQWMLDIRNRHNIPIWCGEAGENSNAWFTDAIKLFEAHNIGWAWWPLKKIESISAPLSVPKSSGYDRLLDYWNGQAGKPPVDFATSALMEVAENLKLENCLVHIDVIDAMFRQVVTTDVKPFVRNDLPGRIYAADYDLGSAGYAYADEVSATYHVSTDTYTSWNNGWSYRNDGVDIEVCSDNAVSNGYNVGWISTDEWLVYTVNIDETAAYDVTLRIAAQSGGGNVHLELDERPVSGSFTIKGTGGWQNWASVTSSGIILEEGQRRLKLYVDTGGFNLNFFEIDNPASVHEQNFACLAASIADDGWGIIASFNKKLRTPLPSVPGGFSLRTTSNNIGIVSYAIDPNGYQLRLTLGEQVFYEDRLYFSYSGAELAAQDGTLLMPFSDLRVKNTLEARQAIPGRIQAEDFYVNNGFQLENSTDSGGGQNLGYSDVGDYVDYLVTIKQSGTFDVDYRIASESNGGRVDLILIDETSSPKIHSVTFPVTGGWQTWRTVTQSAVLPEGRYTLRIQVTRAGFNLNWMLFKFISAVKKTPDKLSQYALAQNYPNPFNSATTIRYTVPELSHVSVTMYNLLGEQVATLVDDFHAAGEFHVVWEAANIAAGLYFCRMRAGEFEETRRVVVLK